ncbi:helix-turn-helix domain-containing protein [Virgibacillus doumboii]|uniref:helix-turn-helix domain-containing protein n=1 Tax=Virgibacillus doumboii TaxID=2697503 RepID=UPI0013DF75B4|nr:helix-turn-helix transcriptional regulator [Virgibacillus doumboii]
MEVLSQYHKQLGSYLRNRRKELNKTQAQVAADAKCSDKHLGKLENGKYRPQYETVYKLCHVLDIDMGDLKKKLEPYHDELFEGE